MNETTPSATALVVALIRATHTRTAASPLINDPWGDQLVPGPVVSAIRQSMLPGGGSDGDDTQADIDDLLRASPAYANVVLRTRYTEDALAAAVSRGIKQYVLIGAGFDSYALRTPAGAEHLRVFEIDHPATQDMKTRRLADCDIGVNERVQFLPADLSREALGAVLAKSSFNPEELTFFSLLGVTMYLSPADNRATMREIAKCGAPGSELVFTYIDQAIFSAGPGPAPEAFTSIQKSVASVGEPFIGGFDPATLAGNLEKAGLRLEEDLTDPELIARYDPAGANGLVSAPQSRIARARTAAL
jgi:methyltransferase (TIGR00027 family)